MRIRMAIAAAGAAAALSLTSAPGALADGHTQPDVASASLVKKGCTWYPGPDYPYPLLRKVTASAAHLRSRPSSHSTSKGLLKRGTKAGLICVRYTSKWDWDYVTVYSGANKGRHGWVSSRWLKVCEDAQC